MEIWTIRKLALLSIAALSLSACQQLAIRTQPQPEPKPVAEQPPPESPPQPPPPPDSMPASRRVQKALQLLDLGDYRNARDQLTWALQEKPGLQIADKLIEQIDADPVEYLGMKNFYYRVESGDSLSIIAGKFLDDPLKFVILARYNKLENPSQLAPGDRIRVPGAMPDQIWQKKKKKKVRHAKRPSADTAASSEAGAVRPPEGAAAPTGLEAASVEAPSGQRQTGDEHNPPQALPPPSLDQVLATARKLHSAGELPAAIHELESEGSRYANTKAVQTLQIDYSREYADLLVKQDDLEGARGVLEKLILLDGSNDQTVNSLIRVEDKLESRKLYRRGADLLGQDHVEEAYNVFTQALTYDPDNRLAKQAQLKSRDRLTDTYHRLAMQHFRRQELDQAIALWDKILAIDPDHTLAAGYKARAVEMKQKLEQIESGK